MKQFTGESSNGSIEEALSNAIENAKLDLMTDFVQWKLDLVEGQDGGFVLVHNVKVTISASTATK